MSRIILAVIVLFALQSCNPILKQIKEFTYQNQYHGGFYLYDPADDKVLVDYQGNKYFTPASNTKILTLYGAGKFLNDPLPSFYIKEDSAALYAWPTGNPSFLNQYLDDTLAYGRLSSAKRLVLNYSTWDQYRYGSGWMWNDFDSSYQPELAAFPIYSGLATFRLDTITNKLKVTPDFLIHNLSIAKGPRFRVTRAENTNQFYVVIGDCNNCKASVPIRFDNRTIARTFRDTLYIPVSVDYLPKPEEYETISSVPLDSILKEMMQTSDNYIAEQMLLQVAETTKDTLNTYMAIDTIEQHLSQVLPDPLIWVDGSGLSRYNMTTPRNVVMLWNESLKIFGKERLMEIVAIGGTAGTIKNWYAADPPYIYGKTGTVRHNHVLSGMLIAKSGRMLLFAYMHNHYQSGSSVVKEEMERTLRDIYEKY